MKATTPLYVVLVNVLLFWAIFGAFYVLNDRLADADATILTTHP